MDYNLRWFIIGGIIFFFLSSFVFLLYNWIFNSFKLRNYIIFNGIILLIALLLYIFLLIYGRGFPIPKIMNTASTPASTGQAPGKPADKSDPKVRIQNPVNNDQNLNDNSDSGSVYEDLTEIDFCSGALDTFIRNPSTVNPHNMNSIDQIIKIYLEKVGLQ